MRDIGYTSVSNTASTDGFYNTPVPSCGLSNAINVLRHDDLNAARIQQQQLDPIPLRARGNSDICCRDGTRFLSRPDGQRFLRDSIMCCDAGHGGDEGRRSAYASTVAQHTLFNRTNKFYYDPQIMSVFVEHYGS